MWEYIRKKLRIKTNTDELLDLNTKVYESIKLSSECLSELNNIRTEIERNQAILNELDRKIKAIPKEIVVKNVLSI